MPHDGQVPPATPVLPELLSLTAAALPPVETLLATATSRMRAEVTVAGKPSADLIDAAQTAAHGLAWLATYAQSLRQMQAWAARLSAEDRFGPVETLLLQIAFGEYLGQITGGIPMSQGEIIRPHDIGLTAADLSAFETPAIQALRDKGNTQDARMALVALMQDMAGRITVGDSGLDDEFEMIREQFRRFAVEKVEPVAHDWHLNDELIPMDIIAELADMGVFGLTIPEEYGGLGLPKTLDGRGVRRTLARVHRGRFAGHGGRKLPPNSSCAAARTNRRPNGSRPRVR